MMLRSSFESAVFYFSLSLLAYFLYLWIFKRKYKLPPGPFAWPFIGTLPDPYSSPLMYKKLLEHWKDKYGDIILFKRMGINFVFINDYNMGYQAFTQAHQKELSGRPLNSVDRLCLGDRDIFFTKSWDSEWNELRKQLMIILRKVAEPVKMTEISNKAYELFSSHITGKKELVEEDGFYIEPIAYWVGHNMLVQVLCQETVEFGDRDYQDTISMFWKIMTAVGNLALYDITPFNALPYSGKQELINYSKILSGKFQKQIENRRKSEIYKTKPNFFVDFCLDIQEGQKENNSRHSKLPKFDDYFISNFILDLYFAGMDTFGIGFSWTVGLLATHPHVQQKIREEIRMMGEKTGESFNDTWMDQLHYLNAVINEVMRIHSLSSFTSYHRAMSDVKIEGYDIPKDTIVTLNIYGMHHDTKYWKDPAKFDPERFLKDGQFQLPKEGFLPFGAGRRTCIAERYIVKESHFIFTGRICQDFQIIWSAKNKTNKVEEDMENTFFRHTAPFYVEFVPLDV